MSKLLIFNFDGTCNEPQQAVQEMDNGFIEDDNITNILKFHLLSGGDLKHRPSRGNTGQLCFYYSGIGTYGNVFQRKFNAGLSSERLDVARILRTALKDFDAHYKKGDRVLLTGFSRGAALARRFASLINDRVKGRDIIEAVFDTVASIGLPNMNRAERPKTEVVFENGHTLPSNVLRALHCLSLDDKRIAFRPTLMNHEDRIHELWFAGAHSDVGGGYYYDGLADNVLRYMLEWVAELDWEVKLMTPAEIDYKNLVDSDAGYEIQLDDVSIDPNVFGKSHEQERTPLISRMTLADRVICVIENDEKTQLPPKVHHSVALRIAGDREYRPGSLKGVYHQMVYDDTSTKFFNGISAHIENELGRIRILAPGEEATVVAMAWQMYNRTGIYLEKDVEYEISVKKKKGKDQQWKDGSILCDASGWDRGDVKLGLEEIAIAGMEPFRRVSKADWFCLCGSLGDTDDTAFEIGKKKKIRAGTSDELCLFANDLKRFYGNNFGKLWVTVKRVG